jgi:hypothetical protein
MAKFEIDIDIKGIDKQLNQITSDIKKGVEQGLQESASEIKDMEQRQIEKTTGNGSYVPTGQLKRSVTIMPLVWSPYSASISIAPMALYADFVENGTGIYAPGGRQGGWVYPVGDGTFVFTEGMPPHYFVQDTFDYYVNKVPAIVEEHIYKCLR